MSQAWHVKGVTEIAADTGTDLKQGLSSEAAAARLVSDGPNEIRSGPSVRPAAVFVRQFGSLIIWVLIAAAGMSIALGEQVDAAIILAVVLLNAAIGAFLEYRAERAVAALTALTAPKARVIRSGEMRVVPASEVVAGDLLLLEAGELVAADGRLLETAALRTNEAPLTGESVPADKRVDESPADTPLAERWNMVFLGTSVASGTGLALVVATGMRTEVGHIATLLETATSGVTPLERKLEQVGRRLLWICLVIVLLMFGLGVMRKTPPFDLFLTAVSLAVAAIPEGLPAVVTIALAVGVQRMARRRALVRRLPAVETLGCVQVICTDKTGTLTMGEMTARRLVTAAGIFSVTGEGYATEGAIFADGAEATAESNPLLGELLLAAAACNDARLGRSDGRVSIIGDPTEGALLVLAAKGGLAPDTVEATMPRAGSFPFTSERKRMTVVCRRDDSPWAFVKGAPEVILERCTRLRTPGGVEALSEADRAGMLEASALMASEALRVLAVAERRLDSFVTSGGTAAASELEIERDLTLLGLIAMQDPPRPEASEAIRKCKRAGMRVVMITGDHPDTARAIARELGILEHPQEVLVGPELERMDDEELARRVPKISVYARTSAEHKLRIIRAWKARRAVVAMTGDGVNDAPALKEAAVGVAMGLTGTEVARQAADFVVTDDNFASIVAAVEEGRGIYDNIAETLAYLMGGNAGELAVMLVAAVIGWPLPLLPIHLLWINLMTDGLPAVALATDPIEADVMLRPPRHPEAEIMDRRFFRFLLLKGTLTAGVALAAFASEFYAGGTLAAARNAAFFTVVAAELLRSLGARSNVRTIWEMGLLSNFRLLLIVGGSFALQIAIHRSPAAEMLFGTEAISLVECARWVGLGSIPLIVIELSKLAGRERRPGSTEGLPAC